MDFLKSAVVSAISKEPVFPYKFGDPIALRSSIWKLYDGTRRSDGADCSIFSFSIVKDSARAPIARNAVRKLRTLRHPGIIKILDTIETDAYIYVATERVHPVQWIAGRGKVSEEIYKWGLYSIACTVSFLNDEATSLHGNVRLESVFTSQSGEWQLGGLDFLSSMKDDEAVIYRYGSMMPDAGMYAPPEVTKTGWDVVKRNPLAATDSWGLGILIFEVFNDGIRDPSQIGTTKSIPPSMQQTYKKLLSPNPKTRLSVSDFVALGKRSGGFFQTALIRLTQDIDNIGLKSDSEREVFLDELNETIDEFPKEFFSTKVLPELLKSVEFGGGGQKVFVSILRLGTRLPSEEWQSSITPVIVRLFGNPDRTVRLFLLECLPQMIEHLSQKLVTDKIFPHMTTGFIDTAPLVREQSVKAVLVIINKLTDRVINGELLKHLAKTANDEQPGIRTNTTICMGKIARNLGANTRQKVLTAAFTRSLRDPFVHARSSALLALAATSDLFGEEDCAMKILPALCPLLIDRERIVREQATKTFDIYAQKIRRYATSLPESVLTSTGPANTNGSGARAGTQSNETAGWTGWAISSFATKVGNASGAMQAKEVAAPLSLSDAQSAISTNLSGTVRPMISTSHSESHLGRDLAHVVIAETHEVEDQTDELDGGWGEDAWTEDAWALAEDDAIKSNTVTDSLPVTFDDGGEPDFEGWLNAKALAKTKSKLSAGKAQPKLANRPGRESPLGRVTTAGVVGNSPKPKMPASSSAMSAAAHGISSQRATEETEDDWGDAWD